MIHGPCSVGDPCHRGGRSKCKFGFPFNFTIETDISGRKPYYRRPNDGSGFFKFVGGNRVWVDNRWVVPYNPFLLLRYNGHINVIYCPSASGCKYFHGYVTRGHHGNKVDVSIVRKNQARPALEPYDHDEHQQYKEMRVMGTYEARYKITRTQMAHMYPPVDVLQLHLPNEQFVIHEEGSEEQALQRSSKTQLTEWFKLNEIYGPHRGKVYCDVIQFYKWKPSPEPHWSRQNRHSIGRVPIVSTAANSEFANVVTQQS